MNFIAHDAAYALFPNATFLRRTCLTFGDGMEWSSNPRSIYDKYSSRGFNISSIPAFRFTSPRSGIPSDETKGIQFGDRFIGGKSSWIIPFDTAELAQTNDVNDGAYSLSTLRNNSFSLLPNIPAKDSFREPSITRNPPSHPSTVPIIIFKNVKSKSLGGNIVLSPKYPKTYVKILELARKREESKSGKEQRHT
jgi:hypothetical protein